MPGGVPSGPALAAEHGVGLGTAYQAVVLLRTERLLEGEPRRLTVAHFAGMRTLADPDAPWRCGPRREHASCRVTVRSHAMSRAEADLLGLAVGTAALLAQRTRYDGEGHPVEVADLVLPADRWDVAISLACVSPRP